MSSANESICIAITMSRGSENKSLSEHAKNIRSLAITSIQGSEASQAEQDRKVSRLNSAYKTFCDSMGTDNAESSLTKFEQAVQSATGIHLS